jgi:hypothetical protein
MAVGNVYVAEHRVQKLLQQAIHELEGASESGTPPRPEVNGDR